MIPVEQINKVIHHFYDKAKTDILIGYHFTRTIKNFDEHIPKIVSFWDLQFNQVAVQKKYLPFDLIGKHKDLKINLGEVHRWVLLFNQTLNELKISEEDKKVWLNKIEIFKERVIRLST
ncbi:MAG: hypothetical protein N4A33_04200 [Bacteriovoracaceae bacterium]|jgi:hemoglobin|nr:hypothetical protein [Bacteriovoracaceae bacterium]